MNKYIIGSVLCILMGSVLSFAHFNQNVSDHSNPSDSKKINLAMRQMAHHLYASEGNDSSRIAPIKHLSANEYTLKLDNQISYDTLPILLDKAFRDFGIQTPYFVSIQRCASNSIILGYSFQSFINKEIPCIGRELHSQCNIISINFEEATAKSSAYLPFGVISIGFGMLGLLLGYRQKTFLKTKKERYTSENHITIGNSIFTPKSLLIKLHETEKTLTFREAKLLEYFASHPNQILGREQIKNYVWKDEGVIVGRSLDVFISRLRKILKPDASLSIKNIHGVGYKLEIISN